MAAQYRRGTEVRYFSAGMNRRAQVAEIDPATGAVLGINVLVLAGEGEDGLKHWHVDFGVTDPKEATTAQERVTDGFFHREQ